MTGRPALQPEKITAMQKLTKMLLELTGKDLDGSKVFLQQVTVPSILVTQPEL